MLWWIQMIIACVLLVFGGMSIAAIYDTTRGEYDQSWWLSWYVAWFGGMLILAANSPVTTSFFVLSLLVSGLMFLISLFMGQDDDEWYPLFWLGLSTGIFSIIGMMFDDNSTMLIILAVVALLGIPFGLHRRSADEHYYDAGYLTSGAALTLLVFLQIGAVSYPLDYLNNVQIPAYNTAMTQMEKAENSYQMSFNKAQSCRDDAFAEYGTDTENAGLFVMLDESFAKADSYYKEGLASKTATQGPRTPVSVMSENLDTTVVASTKSAKSAKASFENASRELSLMCGRIANLAQRMIYVIAWVEKDEGIYLVGFYKILMNSENEVVSEELIADQYILEGTTEPSMFDGLSDSENKNWRKWSYRDYEFLVDSGAIAPMPYSYYPKYDDDWEDTKNKNTARYLFGDNPSSGKCPGAILGCNFPIVFTKEEGSLILEEEDEGNVFMGDDLYGYWGIEQSDGTCEEIPEDQPLPEDAVWCDYFPEVDADGNPGRSDYFYYRGTNGSYYRGPRKCIDCYFELWKRGYGNALSRDHIARMNKLDAPTLRNPGQLGISGGK